MIILFTLPIIARMTHGTAQTKELKNTHTQLEVVSEPYDSNEESTSVFSQETLDSQQLQQMQLAYLKNELHDLNTEYQQTQFMQHKRMRAIQDQIETLERLQQASSHDAHERAWAITDTVFSWILVALSILTLIPIFFVLFGVIGSKSDSIRWVSFGLAAFAMLSACFTWMFAKRLPKTKAAAIMFVAAVLMLGFAWLIQ